MNALRPALLGLVTLASASSCSEVHHTLIRPARGTGWSTTPRAKVSPFATGGEVVNPVFATAPGAAASTPAPRPAALETPAAVEPAPSTARARRMQEDPLFHRLAAEGLKLDDLDRTYRRVKGTSPETACAQKVSSGCALVKQKVRNADARHALERRYGLDAG